VETFLPRAPFEVCDRGPRSDCALAFRLVTPAHKEMSSAQEVNHAAKGERFFLMAQYLSELIEVCLSHIQPMPGMTRPLAKHFPCPAGLGGRHIIFQGFWRTIAGSPEGVA
jgi:hypothetical protein